MKTGKTSQRSKGKVFDIDNVARLATLPLSENEKKTFAKQLAGVLNYFEKLKDVNTEKVASMTRASSFHNVSRSDEQTEPSLSSEQALKNAKNVDNNFFKIDAIFEEI